MTATEKMASGATVLMLLLFGGWLWAQNGAAVFLDMLAASFAGCFL